MHVTKEQLHRALNSQPEFVGVDFTDRVWAVLLEIIEEDIHDVSN